MKGKFISIWDNGTVSTPAEVNEETSQITTNSVEANGMEILIEELFESEDGEEYNVCPVCHEYLLNDELSCMNPDCENH